MAWQEQDEDGVQELRQPDGATDARRRRAIPNYHYVRPRCVRSPLASTTNWGTARRVMPTRGTGTPPPTAPALEVDIIMSRISSDESANDIARRARLTGSARDRHRPDT